MDFFVEFCRTLIYFLVLGGCAFCGICIGKFLRNKKSNKTEE